MIHPNINCTGCRACELICPFQAISMRENEEGFLYPVVDTQKCIECGQCDKHCHLYTNKEFKEPIFYAAQLDSDCFLQQSTSGGAFVALAKWILQNKGIVVGCAYDENFSPQHVCVEQLEDLHRLQGSKYVESDVGNTFHVIKTHLKKGRLVLFSGTGCQVAGLKAFLGEEYSNLWTMDLICHGVPSRRLFLKNIEYLAKKASAKVAEFQFRSKEKGWGPYIYSVKYRNGMQQSGGVGENYYFYHFMIGSSYRECCYHCKYANLNRYGDFTIGDFWGVEKSNIHLKKEMGVSLMMANSPKAKKLLEQEVLSLKVCQVSKEEAIQQQQNLHAPTNRPERRTNFYSVLEGEKYERADMVLRTTLLIKRLIPERIKKCVKKLLVVIRKRV